MKTLRTCLLIIAMIGANSASADEIRVAVASNFRFAIEALAPAFEKASGHDVTLIFGSTGQLFTQISNGAPFDVFLAADELRPRMLEEDQVGIVGTRFVYAIGKLVLWSPRQDFVDADGERLTNGDYRFLAIANPTLAPYGRAARQVLQSLGIWESVQPRLVRGTSVGQAYQFVISENAQLGFVAYSQIVVPDIGPTGSWWDIPMTAYDPIRQQGMLIKDTPATRGFVDYLRGDQALEIMSGYGYRAP